MEIIVKNDIQFENGEAVFTFVTNNIIGYCEQEKKRFLAVYTPLGTFKFYGVKHNGGAYSYTATACEIPLK